MEDAGLCARAPDVADADGRRAVKPRCRLRSGEGAWKMLCELRDLRDAGEGAVGVSERCSRERGQARGCGVTCSANVPA